MSCSIFKAKVYGPAGAQTAKCSFPDPVNGEMVTFEANDDSGSWRQRMVKSMLSDKPNQPLDESVQVELVIYVSRSMDQYESRGGLILGAPSFPKIGKSIDDIAREALKAAQVAGWLVDDSRVAKLRVNRRYTSAVLEPERVEVTMTLLDKVKEGDEMSVTHRG